MTHCYLYDDKQTTSSESPPREEGKDRKQEKLKRERKEGRKDGGREGWKVRKDQTLNNTDLET